MTSMKILNPDKTQIIKLNKLKDKVFKEGKETTYAIKKLRLRLGEAITGRIFNLTYKNNSMTVSDHDFLFAFKNNTELTTQLLSETVITELAEELLTGEIA